tara:strand:+ start:251 stop:769 length:519 start_codon:yes stop_codon:yes gene_type:complete
MNFNYNYLIIIAVLGCFLLYSYYKYISNIDNVSKLWGNSPSFYKDKLFFVSFVLCAIAFLSLFVYLATYQKFDELQIEKIFLGLLGVVLISLFWLPLTIFHLTYKKDKCLNRMLILLTLFIVAISSIYLTYQINNINDKSLFKQFVFYGMCYFCFHTFVLDLFYWSYGYFLQ